MKEIDWVQVHNDIEKLYKVWNSTTLLPPKSKEEIISMLFEYAITGEFNIL